MPQIDTGNTAWVLVCSALVLLMTPGLALFYGGMVRSKSVLNMMMMSFGALGVVSVLWVLFGFSVSFGDSVGGLVGDPTQFWGMAGLFGDRAVLSPDYPIPTAAFAGFQAAFAVITVALVSGAIADRARFGSWLVFAGVWATVVYFPVAHWVFAFDGVASPSGGWIVNDLKAIDFAGGTAVHINAGAAGLALALVLGRRIGFGREPVRPHNLTLVMLGAGLLWFGWFGFNAGSELAADVTAAGVWLNTMVATGAAMLAWLTTERIRDGHPTSLGAASGVVAGLVAITPACSSVSPLGAVVVGASAGTLCALAVSLKHRFGFDDSLDVVGVHLVGGWVGTVLVGLLATSQAPFDYGDLGLFYGGGFGQLGRQVVAAAAVTIFSFVAAFGIGKAIEVTIGFRLGAEDEVTGIDLTTHAESAYDFGSVSAGGYQVREAAVRQEKVRA